MDTVTIPKKEYRALRAAQHRLAALSNQKKIGSEERHTRIEDLVGVLSDVKEFKGKSSVQVQHMIPEIWSRKYGTRKNRS